MIRIHGRLRYRLTIYLITSLLVLVMSWEHQKYVAATVLSAQNQNIEIPEESMRLRILAHSDSVRDQWLKREVRDEIVQQITEWVEEVETLEEAREQVQLSLPEIEQIVGQTIQEHGFDYTFSVEYGQIAFPSKLYGNKLYPAGEYEGLLVKIGYAQGDNWWCVLFPPLCFVDFGTGEVQDPDQEAEETDELEKEEDQDQIQDQVQDKAEENVQDQIEVRFFLVELFTKIKNIFV